jgi:hypothetical protein
MKSDLELIKNQLLTYGEVSRNWCLREIFCSRLAARIQDLKRQGWTFETEKRGGDFYYKAMQVPASEPRVLARGYIDESGIKIEKLNQLTLKI